MNTNKLIKYNKNRVDVIITALKNLQSKNKASKAAGIEYHTFKKWYDNIPDFRQKVDQALEETREDIKTQALDAIINAFKTDYKAAAWILERMFPEEFGRREKIDQTMEISQVKIKYVLPEDTQQNDIPTITFTEPKQIEPTQE